MMLDACLVFLLALFLSAPAFDAGEGANQCYVVGKDMDQKDPCKPAETRGWKNR